MAVKMESYLNPGPFEVSCTWPLPGDIVALRAIYMHVCISKSKLVLDFL